ncbi:MAG: rhodanese-like domain-containing protein [Saprospiraceae bacterium]
MFSFIKKLLGIEELNYGELMDRKVVIIDVRTPQEYQQGHVKNSINIPLYDIGKSIKKIKQKNKPIITCCRSGARSGNAAATLKSAGIEVYNGGSWNSVQKALRN